ncbi:MAG TPA: hypothetical protein VGF70_08820 [Solirubrobacteraceae bacterium]
MERLEKGSIRTVIRRVVPAGLLLAGSMAAIALAASPPVPIPSSGTPPARTFIGRPAVAHPIRGVPQTPQNRFMAPNGTSEIHDDAWQTDTSRWAGPMGHAPQTISNYVRGDCGSTTFDSQGRVVSVCVGVPGPQLYMFDPNTLATLATFKLPPRQSVPQNIFQDFTGGGYFYLNNHDQVVVSTTTKHIFVIAETAGPGFRQIHDYDLSKIITSQEKITSALPDSNGLLWVVTKTDGKVLTLNLRTGRVHHVQLGHGSNGEIENSIATDQHGGVYIATTHKLYRFGEGPGGAPKVVWAVTYPNSGQSKPGQVDAGTGTTPTVMPGGYVNITDNADPMDIVVYRTAPHPYRRSKPGHRVPLPRQVCRVPVFSKGSSADENSIISAGDTMIAEDNYGYEGPQSLTPGTVTTPGFVRVDLNRNGLGCHRVWLNTGLSAPTVVSKVALANGLLYTYTTDTNDNWFWTALSFRTGKLVYKAYSGTGFNYNNNYAGISISRSGREYLGTLGGIISLRDR